MQRRYISKGELIEVLARCGFRMSKMRASQIGLYKKFVPEISRKNNNGRSLLKIKGTVMDIYEYLCMIQPDVKCSKEEFVRNIGVVTKETQAKMESNIGYFTI